MKIGFTGSRYGINREQERQIRNFLSNYLNIGKEDELHHGCCVGSDESIHSIIRRDYPEVRLIGHPPKNDGLMARDLDYDDVYPAYEYSERNKHIVDETEILIATPDGAEYLRSGTWSTIRYAMKKRYKSVFIFRGFEG